MAMIDLRPIISRIESLLEEGSAQSVTYAALEARLALEKVCYDRLRQRHDYISHDELDKWQPRAVINKLIADVDPHLGNSMRLMIGSAVSEGVKQEDDEYVEIATEVGFDPKKIAKMWNALGNLALHVRLPKDRNDHIPDYGDAEKIRSKVEEVLVELRELAKGTMVFSGFGTEVSFECSCGQKNRRRESLLRDGQHIICINPECKYTWKVVKEVNGFSFEAFKIQLNCTSCQADHHFPWRAFADMKNDAVAWFICRSCGHKNHAQWRLMMVQPGEATEPNDETPAGAHAGQTARSGESGKVGKLGKVPPPDKP